MVKDMEITRMFTHDKATTNYTRLVVMQGKTRILDIVNPTNAEIDCCNDVYPLACVTNVASTSNNGNREIRFYI